MKLENVPGICEIMRQMREMLKCNKFNGHYFDRKSQQLDRICDHKGVFYCEGRFDENQCKYQQGSQPDMMHFINPYQSSEARILFSTWNLDHV